MIYMREISTVELLNHIGENNVIIINLRHVIAYNG